MAVREKRTLKDDGVVLAASTKTVQRSVHGERRRGVVSSKQVRILHIAIRSSVSNPQNEFGIAAERVDGYINPLFYHLLVSITLHAFGLLPKYYQRVGHDVFCFLFLKYLWLKDNVSLLRLPVFHSKICLSLTMLLKRRIVENMRI